MGAIQSSINSVIGTVAAATVAADRGSVGEAVKAKVATAEQHVEGVKGTNKEEAQKAQTDVDEKKLQAKLGKMEQTNPSESNPDKGDDKLAKRMAQATDARQAVTAAQTAQNNLKMAQRAQQALLDSYNFNKTGMINKVAEANSAINVRPTSYDEELNRLKKEAMKKNG